MSCTRRTFLTAASGLALGTRLAASTTQGANNRIRVGVIGTGGRARGLMNQLKKLPACASHRRSATSTSRGCCRRRKSRGVRR